MNNRLPNTVASYDGRGNVTTNWIAPGGTEFYAFDGLDRQIAHQTASLIWSYLYDGDKERIAKILSSNWTYTFRDEAKRVSSEFGGTSPSRDNVFLGNLLAASYASIPGNDRVWTFYSSDHLGTPRLITDVAAAMVETPKNWPYGENVTTPGPFQRIRFASMERDTEASRYHDHARGHEFNLGRFLSPDLKGGRPAEPQSWNRYAYGANNPLKYVDPNGQEKITFTVMTFIAASTARAQVPGFQFGPRFAGDNRTFGLGAVWLGKYRTIQQITVETDPSKGRVLRGNFRDTGVTTNVDTGQTAKASASGLMVTDASRDPSGSPSLGLKGSAANPLVPGAPPIEYSLQLTANSVGNRFSGTVDLGGYPSLEVYATNESGQTVRVLQYDEKSATFGSSVQRSR